MQSNIKKSLCRASKKSSFFKRNVGSLINSSQKNKSSCKMSYNRRCKLKPRSTKVIGSLLSKRRKTEFSCSGHKKHSYPKKQVKRAPKKVSTEKSREQKNTASFRRGNSLSYQANKRKRRDNGGVCRMLKRKKQKTKSNIEMDEASRLKRRTRYLLVKMKFEQNLIDAYSGEGWKGQSREKIKPEKELLRAKKQIIKFKLGIRDAIHQLDMLSSEGKIGDVAISSDGSVFHENVFCAKCKLQGAFPKDDIIICNGVCNRAFHQKCLEPPLENYPPEGQGWRCKFCECKNEILEVINAHLGTRFSLNSDWQDIFKEAATFSEDRNVSLDPEEEWPSDDSKDDDYDPRITEKTCSISGIEECKSNDCSSSSGLFWSSDEASSLSGNRKRDGINKFASVINLEDDASSFEILNSRRQRRDVDYKKLYDEMFGKNAQESELSEDDDWGPRRRKRRKQLDQGSNGAKLVDKDGCLTGELAPKIVKKLSSISHDKKKVFRIPPSAVEKLRLAFAENELPSRAMKENLSKQLGIASDKVNKWFKNARYTALKNRKENTELLPTKSIVNSLNVEIGMKTNSDQVEAKTDSLLGTSLTDAIFPKNIQRYYRRKKPRSVDLPLKLNRRSSVLQPSNTEVSKRFGKSVFCKRSKSLKSQNTSKMMDNHERKLNNNVIESCEEQLYLMELERLHHLEDKVEKLRKVLQACGNRKPSSSKGTSRQQQDVVYVPVAVVREKIT